METWYLCFIFLDIYYERKKFTLLRTPITITTHLVVKEALMTTFVMIGSLAREFRMQEESNQK